MTSRMRIYDAEDIARDIRETFVARKVERHQDFRWQWPRTMQQIGEGLASAYLSDKWQDMDEEGRRAWIPYKHLRESRHWVFAKPGILHRLSDPRRKMPVIGPKVSFEGLPLMRQFAYLSECDALHVQLYTRGTDEEPELGSPNDGVVEITVPKAMWGGAKILWSKDDPREKDEVLLFVYTQKAGVMFIILGEKLDIRPEGIVG